MDGDVPTVPPPEPPDSGAAWYAPAVRDQYEIVPGVVATVAENDGAFEYRIRTPALSAAAAADLEAISAHFSGASLRRPRTREGAAERFREGFDRKYERVVDRLTDRTASARRRLAYHLLAELRCLGRLTPHALDDRIEVADHSDGELSVHLTDYAPARTGIEDPDFLGHFSAERVERYTVTFAGYEIPVVRYRERLLGTDPFEHKYAVLEPELLPGDERLIEECKARIWEAGLDEGATAEDRTALVRKRGRRVLSRRFAARNTREWVGTVRHVLRRVLAEYGQGVPPVDRRVDGDRLDDLLYYVLRDLVGYGQLTVPIRDPNLEDIEANRVGERIKVVPNGGDREPTNLRFESETAFINVATQLAADDGVELSSSRPSAKVNLEPAGIDQTIRCAVALPTISEDGPHVSIRKQASDVLTPVDLVDSGSLPTELVTLLWLLYEHRGVVLFSGPTAAGKTTLLNAHMPFIAYDARPVSIDEGAREVFVPHETGVSLTTRAHRDEFKNVSMADLMTETNYLNPDTEVIGEINTAESFETFSEVLQTGHGVLGTTHADGIEKLLNRVIEKGLPPYLLLEIDLVVFPRHVDGERYVGAAVELLSEREAGDADYPTETIEKDGTTIHYSRILERTPAGEWTFAYRHPELGDPTERIELRAFDRLAERTNRTPEDVESEFRRKHGYIEYLVREDVSDIGTLFGFLSDLRANEAATIERIRRRGATDG
ncbi:type II/IV secretion system ATPase subunit [Natronomonas sp. F2-12]|uniref:Type II/IV secretion system ATPase subunit n=1 Tax=Natronomonas aquatica TaxID=2841590 RepID=A0A9R1D660_9EURY|nr:type II/IV secretion system ATPase subunit [Natronomonas aquatica]MCQ4333881.1 type II/IV secretion system ATPase subunit [Natronomonas aquatica]